MTSFGFGKINSFIIYSKSTKMQYYFVFLKRL